MTSHRYRRCIHCGLVYAFQASGGGCGRPENSSKWCPGCALIAKAAIKEALKDVPIKRKRVMVETDEVTLKELLDHRTRRMAEVKEEGKIWCERVGMCLYDMKNPDRHNRVHYIKHEKKLYYVSYWTVNGTIMADTTIQAEMELNTETGEMRPWDEVGGNTFDWFGSY